MLAIGRVGRTVLPDFLPGVILTHDAIPRDAIHAVACCHNTPSQVHTRESQVNHTTSQVQTVQFLRGVRVPEANREILPVAYFGPEGGLQPGPSCLYPRFL
jgi:hypothetical protein